MKVTTLGIDLVKVFSGCTASTRAVSQCCAGSLPALSGIDSRSYKPDLHQCASDGHFQALLALRESQNQPASAVSVTPDFRPQH